MIAALLVAWLAAPTDTSALRARLDSIARASGGRMGIAVVHVERGDRVVVNGGELYPMHSVYKLPIALEVLRRVERGQLSLETPVRMTPSDARLGYTPLTDSFPQGGVTRTVRQLLEATLIESDNAASDLLLELVGGGGPVTARLRELGVWGVRVDRSEAMQSFDDLGATRLPPSNQWTLEKIRALVAAVPPDAQLRAARASVNEARDTATPQAMAALLHIVLRGDALDPTHTALILDLMTRTTRAPKRIKGSLPAGTKVAHRPGTAGTVSGFTAAVNDVGIITLPSGDHLIVVAFVKRESGPVEQAERAIASAARAAYDWAMAPRR